MRAFVMLLAVRPLPKVIPIRRVNITRQAIWAFVSFGSASLKINKVSMFLLRRSFTHKAAAKTDKRSESVIRDRLSVLRRACFVVRPVWASCQKASAA